MCTPAPSFLPLSRLEPPPVDGPAFVNWVRPVTLAAGMLYVLAPIQLFVLHRAGGGRKQHGEPLTSIPPVNFQVMQRPPPFKTRQLIPLSGKRRLPLKEASVLSLGGGKKNATIGQRCNAIRGTAARRNAWARFVSAYSSPVPFGVNQETPTCRGRPRAADTRVSSKQMTGGRGATGHMTGRSATHVNTQQMWVMLMQNASLLFTRHKSVLVPPPLHVRLQGHTVTWYRVRGQSSSATPPSPTMHNKKCLAGSENWGRTGECGADITGGSWCQHGQLIGKKDNAH